MMSPSYRMIISASRRTDIPAFYSDWLITRLRDGFVLVRNPFNPHHLSRIRLSQEVVDFIVFWTKNPDPMLSKLSLVDSFHIPYYFLFTITSYDKSLEKNLPSKSNVIDTFRKLSERIGKRRVVWRYDPILLTDRIDIQYHYEHFESICRRLENHTERCIISFMHMYKKCMRNLKEFCIIATDEENMSEIVKQLFEIAIRYGIRLQTCALEIDLSNTGVARGKCIDDELISDITGLKLEVEKDRYQRKACGCVESIDIGSYNTCMHGCLYCYANNDLKVAEKNHAMHDPGSPLLYGRIEASDTIADREMKSVAIAE
jgi:DNA repair photolyase